MCLRKGTFNYRITMDAGRCFSLDREIALAISRSIVSGSLPIYRIYIALLRTGRLNQIQVRRVNDPVVTRAVVVGISLERGRLGGIGDWKRGVTFGASLDHNAS